VKDKANPTRKFERVFKTAWFAKATRKAHIPAEGLCPAFRQAMLGLADDLVGTRFKKRLRKNQYRSIIVAARPGRYRV
jgi:hypothetical protein